jgi:hypothetical protein
MINETVLSRTALPEVLLKMISTNKVRMKEFDGIIQIMPVIESTDCTIGLRGILSGYDVMSVDNFLERKFAEKDLDL